MCPTFVRHHDIRRQRRRGRGKEVYAHDSSEDDTSSTSVDPSVHIRYGEQEHARGSAKSKFMAQVLSEIVGYGCAYELFQFVYDLWLWTTIGAAKNSTKMPLRLALAGRPFASEYWHIRHAALLDMQRQLGYPTLFFTIAPYEWSLPYHRWIRDEAEKA